MKKNKAFTLLETLIALLVLGICMECVQGGVLFIGTIKKNWKQDVITECFNMDIQLSKVLEHSEIAQVKPDEVEFMDLKSDVKIKLNLTNHKLMLHYPNPGHKTLLYQVKKVKFNYLEPDFEMILGLENGKEQHYHYRVKSEKNKKIKTEKEAEEQKTNSSEKIVGEPSVNHATKDYDSKKIGKKLPKAKETIQTEER